MAVVRSNEELNKYAESLDSTTVKLTGNQTVAGVKTFSSTIVGSIDGNAATATKLATARTIGGVSFDGSANINLPGVNTAGNQNTTGSAGSVVNSEIIKFDTGVTEGTDLYTFNGSSAKTIDIKAGTNVTLTKAAGSITINANDTSVAWSEITSKPTTLAGYGISDATPSSHIGTTGASHGVATTSVDGFMSSADKTKLDGIATNANKYVHPTSGVVAGTYTKITVSSNGHATAGSTPTTLAGYSIEDAYTKTEIDSALTLKTNKSDTDSVNMLRADKFLAAQSIANMIYTNGDLTKIRYNNDTDVNYDVLNYSGGNLSTINHYTGGVLRGTTTLSYTNGNLVSAVFVGV
ncbi:MAG: hypothetical protein ACMV1B_09080 [Prevotella sp.]